MARVANTGIPSPALSDGTPAGGTFYKPAYEVTPPLHQGYVHANGFITPVASPVKSGFVDSDLGFDTPVQMIDKHRVTQLSTPPPEPVSRSSAAGATSKHKKEERQTRISDHLTASKPSAAAPKGKPKKGAAQVCSLSFAFDYFLTCRNTSGQAGQSSSIEEDQGRFVEQVGV